MFTCKKCGKKAKTSYERVFGEKPTFEPVGFYCHTCGIFYDVKTKASSKVVYGGAKKELGGLTAADQERIQMLQKTYTKSRRTVYENGSATFEQTTPALNETIEVTRARRASIPRPAVPKTAAIS